MAEERVERRHIASLAGGVPGYSRLMGADEEGTLAQLKTHRRDLTDRSIKKHRGVIIETTGDGMLVEVASAVEAVRCAAEIQHGMIDRNADVPTEKRSEFRIGIHVGDIIEDDGDIFGDGVNVAARLENMAVRGGICVSRQALDPIEGKVRTHFRELGRQNLKNIARPIEVYAIDFDEAGPPASRVLTAANLKEDIRYCRASAGVRLP